MAKSKAKFYTVWQGRQTGVFSSWDDCKAQVQGFPAAQYKGYATREEAEGALRQPYATALTARPVAAATSAATHGTGHTASSAPYPVGPFLAVDAACSGNPGDMEYRGVWVADQQTSSEWFHAGIYHGATNNIGEFLAIVHGLALLKKGGYNLPLYSDSATAQAWIRAKKCKTRLERNAGNAPVFERIEAAERWLAANTYTTPIYKWRTELWGEIPADFGRK